ncbi:ABC transporter permease [Microbulbifer sp. 2201CG32-9]|uniref:ABC transporter permease n=1 Tax=Microbulbifer sp. 2201CG32-9 TaxID=3232309 RepID=UPI00345B85C7
MSRILQDIGYAWRAAIKKPAISALIVITFALGIGANSAIFSMVYHVMLAPLPYPEGDRLLRLQQHQPVADRMDFGSSVQSFFDYRRLTTGLETLVEYHSMQFTLLGDGMPKRVQTGVVSWNFFKMLGVKPILGRDFVYGEDEPGSEPLILLSHRYWQEQFGGKEDVIGLSLEMNNAVHKVIGVLPPMPAYPDDNDIYISAASCPFRSSTGMINNRRPGMLTLFGKLKESQNLERVTGEVNTIAGQLQAQYPDDYPTSNGYSANLISLKTEMIGDSSNTFILLLIISGLVVLIASANVANINLARASSRSQELAIREAIGASPGRIAQQLLTESILYALAGGVAGLLLAYPTLTLLSDFAADYTPLASEVKMDAMVLFFSLIISVIAGVISGSAAAFSRRNINSALKEGGDKVTASVTGQKWRSGLLTVQMALSFVILTISALVTMSLYKLSNQETGFNAENILAVNLDLNFSNYTNGQQVRDFTRNLLREVSALPDSEQVSVSASFPLASNVLGPIDFETQRQNLDRDEVRPRARVVSVTHQFHSLLGISLLQGRYFNASDDENNPGVVLINRSLAKQFFPDISPLGERLSVDGGQNWLEIIGVVADVRSTGLDQTEGIAFYVPFMQSPSGRVRLLVKSRISPYELRDPIINIVGLLDPQQAIASIQSMSDVKENWLATPTLIASLLGLFGFLSLLITLSGIFGVVSYSIGQRLKEIGIRIAVGATPKSIMRMMLKHSIRMILAGISIGLIGMWLVGPKLQAFLYQTNAFSPLIYLTILLVLVVAAILAVTAPTLRAIKLDPSSALRNE